MTGPNEPNEQYEVENNLITSLLRDIGKRLVRAMPKGWGFTLFIFSYGEKGSMFYLSSAERNDMISAMKEFIAHQEIGYVDPTRKKQ